MPVTRDMIIDAVTFMMITMKIAASTRYHDERAGSKDRRVSVREESARIVYAVRVSIEDKMRTGDACTARFTSLMMFIARCRYVLMMIHYATAADILFAVCWLLIDGRRCRTRAPNDDNTIHRLYG